MFLVLDLKKNRNLYYSKYCQATTHLLWMFGNRSKNELVHDREESRPWIKSCPQFYQEEFGFCLQQAPILCSYFFIGRKPAFFSLLNNRQEVCLLCVELSSSRLSNDQNSLRKRNSNERLLLRATKITQNPGINSGLTSIKLLPSAYCP